MNKMTAKEFLEVLKHVGIHINRYGYEYILVFIEQVFWNEEKEYKKKYPYLANDSMKKARYIHSVLEKHGYYDNVNESEV